MTAPGDACGADRRPESSPPARAVHQNPFHFFRAARLPRFGLRGAPGACLILLAVFVAMPPAQVYPGSAEDITVTANPSLTDVSRNAAAPSPTVTAAERESAGRKPAPAPGIHPPTGWRVQLGAFRSETRSAKARAALAQTLADLPRTGVLVIDDSKGDGLFRVMVAETFAHRGEAAAACAAIAARGAQCFVAPARAAGGASVPAARPPSESAGRKPAQTLAAAPAPVPAPGVLKRLDTLEAENRELRKEIEALKAKRTKPPQAPPSQSRADPAAETTAARFVRTDSKFGYDVLDPTTGINRKQRLILERRNDGTLAPDSLHVHGAVTAIANYQGSNRNDKFGYLMRHPTAKNQVGDTVSEATIHSAQLGFTGTLGDWLTGHAEMLFDPEQSFGDGTNTDIDRNQLQVRRAYQTV